MSETQRKDSSEKQAWEHIAPQLPPGCRIVPVGVDDAPGRFGAILLGSNLFEDTREQAAKSAWRTWERATGITRKRYAELIAPGLVREVAREKHPKCTVRLLDNAECWPQFDVLIFDRDLESWITVSCGSGPTICDAAWSCIQALGGGE